MERAEQQMEQETWYQISLANDWNRGIICVIETELIGEVLMGKQKGQTIYKKTKQYKGYPAQNKRPKGKGAAFVCRLIGIILLAGVIICMMPAMVPRLFGLEIYNVESGSMSPEIPVGSAAYIRVKAPTEVHVNDVVAFTSGEPVILHRVVENDINAREITTKGDANEIEDISKVPYDNVIGTVSSHFAGLGAFMAWCLGSPGRYILLAIAVGGTALILLASRIGKN